MRTLIRLLVVFILAAASLAASPQASSPGTYLGFDRNDYPGDAAMATLRKTFSFTGYWLGPPPGEKTNSWRGKRGLLESQKFGLLLLYSAPDSRRLRSKASAAKIGTADAARAAGSAKAEGFPPNAIIFLDIEEGGRLTDPYHAYIGAFVEGLAKAGFRAGVYCSGMVVDEGDGHTIVTSDDIRSHLSPRQISYWVYNDACPPSPGCTTSQSLPALAASGVSYATVWQFVRSPRDDESAVHCSGYAPDKNCYAALDTARRWHLDMNVASSSDPSHTR
jgi:hypothetical protein